MFSASPLPIHPDGYQAGVLGARDVNAKVIAYLPCLVRPNPQLIDDRAEYRWIRLREPDLAGDNYRTEFVLDAKDL